jgi:ABC-type dipeptide/oligopeptide/nickel transport system permease component
MLTFAIRRAIWAIPTLFGVSLVVFLITTLLPDPSASARGTTTEQQLKLEDAQRARFLDLPRFINAAPEDVRTRVDRCFAHIAANAPDTALCTLRLERIGGAALPFIVPRLRELPQASREQLAAALLPMAERMGITSDTALSGPESATLFWERYWEDRAIEFAAPAVRREVERLVKRGNATSEEALLAVNTFALAHIIEAMRAAPAGEAFARLTRVAAHIANRTSVAKADDSLNQRRAVLADWQSWWYVHETDYVALKGGAKIAASVAQTRYAKWVLGAVTGQLGLSSRDNVPVFDKLLSRATITITMALLALALSAALAVPLGVLSAWQSGRSTDRTIAFVLVVVYAIPTFFIAELLATFGSPNDASVLPVLALATVSLSVMTQQQRASMIAALSQEYIVVARAKGARTLRVIVVHALRNALVPTVTLLGVQFPALLGATVVVEEVFGIRGMGWETMRAIESHDSAWVIAVTLLSAMVTTACLIASDILHGLLDPRVRERQLRRSLA